MKYRKKILIGSIVLALVGQISISVARDDVNQHLYDQAMPMVEIASDVLFIEAPITASTMIVRVFSQNNDRILNERSSGEPIGLMASDLTDGEYHFETVTIYDLDEPVGEGPSYTTQGSRRSSGKFTVDGGVIMSSERDGGSGMQLLREEASILDHVIDGAINLAGVTLDILIPSANAQDLTITDGSPTLIFDDTSNAGTDWSVEGSSNFFDWRVLDQLGTNSNQVIDVNGAQGATGNRDSIVIDSDGDVHLSSNTVNIDESLDNVSIGWTDTTNGNISISDIKPHIWFNDETDTAQGDWQLNEGRVKFWSRPTNVAGWRIPLSYMADAPGNSINIASDGRVGMGTSVPTAALNIQRNDGLSMIKVEETSPGLKTLFQAKANGNVRFELMNTSNNQRWRFTNASTNFVINNVASAETEFIISNTGNAELAGILVQNSDVNSKQDIELVDHQSILEKIAGLEISEWSYIDTPRQRHIGPMAQDFYQTFKLGGNDTSIATLDTSGIALAGVQALMVENDQLAKENLALSRRLDALEAQQAQLQAVLAEIQEDRQVGRLLTSTAYN